MARNRNRRRNSRPQQQPRRKQRKAPRKSRNTLPPARGLMANIFRSVVQCAWDVAQGVLSFEGDTVHASDHPTNVKVDADFGYLLAQDWRQRYSVLFREAKIHKVEAWFMPYASITHPGLYVFNISDIDENKIDNAAGVWNLGAPGSVVRRMNQVGYRVWYPTEPDDRNWFVLSSDHRFLTYAISAAEKAYWEQTSDKSGNPLDVKENASIAGKLIVNTHASFRGKGEGTMKIETTTCYCSRCIRIRTKRLDAQAKMLKDLDFEQLTIPSPVS